MTPEEFKLPDDFPEEWKNYDPEAEADKWLEKFQIPGMPPMRKRQGFQWYMLDPTGQNPIGAPFMVAAMWKQKYREMCRVKHEWVGQAHIMTDFVGYDMRMPIILEEEGKLPIVWETMIFGGPHDQKMDRCGGSREQAEAMHARMVEWVKTNPTREED